jgi:hypothetical protein
MGKHQLLNLYLLNPEEENYIEKREHMKVKICNEYIVNVGLFNVFIKKSQIYNSGKCRSHIKLILQLSDYQKGLHLQMFSLWVLTIRWDSLYWMSNLRHTSNAGLQVITLVLILAI